METKSIDTKCLIIGSGPAGYTAAIYAARANLSPILYSGSQPGGQLTQTTEVENFPGYPNGVTGQQLMEDLKNQALRFGTDIRSGIITGIDTSASPFKVTINGSETLSAATIIIATGASAKYLGLPDETKYAGLGVSACATCDGFFYRKRTVAVVGGGDTACEEAIYLSTLAKKVYLIVRKPFLRASKIMQERVQQIENIEILFNCNTLGLFGEEFVEGAHIVTAWGDVATELAIRLFGDESLFLGYSEVRYTAPVYAGDFMEYSGYVEKVGNTSFTCHFEAHKVIELAREEGLADSAANVLPVLCGYGTGTLVVKKPYQRPEFGDPAFQNR